MQSKSNQIEKIPIDSIEESEWQGRLVNFSAELNEKQKDNVRDLSDSIYKNGLLNPVIVHKTNKGYKLIDGHRRVLAYRMLKRGHIESITIEAGEKEIQAMSIIGNLHRKNLSNIELAIAYKKILDSGLFQSRKELAEASGKDKTFVSDVMNTLKMDSRIIDDLMENRTTDDVRMLKIIRQAGQADDKGKNETQWKIYQEAISKKLTRKQVKELVQQEMEGEGAKGKEFDFSDYPFKVNKKQKSLSIELDTEVLPQEIIEDILKTIKKKVE